MASENTALVEELDALLATQARLQFARENYNEDEAESYGIRLLDFFRKHGLELRAALVSPNTEAKPCGEATSA